MNLSAKKELLELLEEKERRLSRNKFATFFPEDGPLSRHNYPKHMDFFKTGSQGKNERALIAANRAGKCCTFNTLIDTEHGKIPIGELYKTGKPFRVWAWDEKNKKKVLANASTPFRKPGKHKCYNFTMSDGQILGLADLHRVLSSQGSWHSIDSLLRSQSLFSLCHQESSQDTFQSTHVLSDQHSNQTKPDYQAYYLENLRQCDEQPRSLSNTVRSFLPSQAYVLKRILTLYGWGVLGCKYIYSLLHTSPHLSIQGEVCHASGQSSEFLYHTPYNYDKPCHGLRQRYQRLSTVEALQPQLTSLALLDQDEFCAFVNSLLLFIDDNRVVSVSPISSKQYVYDFEVEEHHNYIAGGIVHHNTVAGAYEITCHATGIYPQWWEGKRFEEPCSIWASGDTAETVRDIGQLELLGPITDIGTGMIPGDLIIGKPPKKMGIPDAIELVHVKHVSGGTSTIAFKGYAKGRESFQGTAKHIIWLDEEPKNDIYTECLLRTMTTQGQIIATFTPLKGLSEVVLSFMPGGKAEDTPDTKALITLTWDDAPHLSGEDKEKLFASIPPHQRDARSKGIPALGSGAIYPVPESEIVITPIEIPEWWPRCYALDVGWNNTACLWGAIDPETETTYIYYEYKRGQAEPAIHAQAIKDIGDWIPGVIDPAARGRSQRDGESLLDNYIDLGLQLDKANNAVEAGLYKTWGLLSTGRIKIFNTLTKFLDEYRIYRRDENGRVVKENDHLMDCFRYLTMSGKDIATVQPYDDDYDDRYRDDTRNASTGY